MKIVALLSQKGGSGKTTMAVHLAVSAVLSKKDTVVIDLDPQASASKWKDLRPGDSPIVISTHAERLKPVLDAASTNGADFAVVDRHPILQTSP